jgi:amino acid transporter
VTGWFTSAAYFFWFAAGALITSQLLWALICVCSEAFVVHPWHYYLGYIAFVAISLILNIPLIKVYPYLLKGAVFYINSGALFILIALLVRTHPKQSASFVFTDIINITGWNSNGVVFMLGLLPGTVAVNGFDSAAHMAEEMSNPSRQVPQVMMGSAVLSSITGLAMILVYMFCNIAPDNLWDPIGSQPVAQLMLDAMDSTPLTIIGILIFVTAFLIATVALLTTFSRVWWSFAREGGVPFAKWMSQVTTVSQLPVNAIVFGTIAAILIGLLELGAGIALNAILGSSILCIYASYIIPIFLLLFKRKTLLPEKRYFNLGRFGAVCNVISVVWMIYAFIWLTFPLYLPATAETMNYSIAVFAGVVLVTAINWFCYSNRVYVEPEQMRVPGRDSSMAIVGVAGV